jgi:hypothetical protein
LHANNRAGRAPLASRECAVQSDHSKDKGDCRTHIPAPRPLARESGKRPGRPIRNEYLIVDGGKLAGTGAKSYIAGDATGGSEEAAKFKNAN